MKPELLVMTPLYAPTLDALERDYTVHKTWTAADPQLLVREVAPRVRGLVTTGFVGFKREHIDALPQLEIVGCFGMGHGSYDLAAARERGIVVANTPDGSADSVADVGFALLIAVMRRICEGDRFVRADRWPTSSFPLGRELRGRRCGVVGLGGIGRAFAKRAEAFGMEVCYHGPREKRDTGYRYYADTVEMARDCDVLAITCPLTAESRGMIDANVLAALGPRGFVVNVARGPIIDEQALVRALKSNAIAGAGLDVFWNEPHVPAELKVLDNVVMSPHVGTSTVDIREERGTKLLANLEAYFSGKAVPYRLV